MGNRKKKHMGFIKTYCNRPPHYCKYDFWLFSMQANFHRLHCHYAFKHNGELWRQEQLNRQKSSNGQISH